MRCIANNIFKILTDKNIDDKIDDNASDITQEPILTSLRELVYYISRGHSETDEYQKGYELYDKVRKLNQTYKGILNDATFEEQINNSYKLNSYDMDELGYYDNLKHLADASDCSIVDLLSEEKLSYLEAQESSTTLMRANAGIRSAS